MLTTKLVIRLLDAANAVIGWTEHSAIVRGDGTLRAAAPVSCLIDAPGWVETISIHWADVNVETRVAPPGGPIAVRVGDSVTLYEKHAALLTIGTPPANLPPVVLRQTVAVAVPMAALGAQG
jgi:hypothetical protein